MVAPQSRCDDRRPRAAHSLAHGLRARRSRPLLSDRRRRRRPRRAAALVSQALDDGGDMLTGRLTVAERSAVVGRKLDLLAVAVGVRVTVT